MFCKIFTYVSFMLTFINDSKMPKCSTVSKAFSWSMKPMQSGTLYSFDFSAIWFRACRWSDVELLYSPNLKASMAENAEEEEKEEEEEEEEQEEEEEEEEQEEEKANIRYMLLGRVDRHSGFVVHSTQPRLTV